MGSSISNELSEAWKFTSAKEAEIEKKNAPNEILGDISEIEDIESDKGKLRLANLTQKLRELNGDNEDNSGFKIKAVLPWDEVQTQEQKRKVKNIIYALSKESDLLSREVDELEYDFDFKMEMYAY